MAAGLILPTVVPAAVIVKSVKGRIYAGLFLLLLNLEITLSSLSKTILPFNAPS